MAEKTEEFIRQLHAAGADMRRAWTLYAQPNLKAKWQDLQKQSALDAFVQDVEAAATMDTGVTGKLVHGLARGQAIITARSDLERTLKTNILSYISKGYLHGFGYVLPRSLTSVPVAIPKEAWKGKCNWTEATLKFRGLEFADVRLTTNRIRNEILKRGVVDKTPTNRAGRPSVGSAIEAAFHALLKEGEIDSAASQSSHYPKVRTWLELNEKDLSVPPAHISRQTLYRHFSPLFRGL